MITLYDFQSRAVAGISAHYKRGHKRALLVSPTGSGKTVIFAYLAHKIAAAGQSVVILAHRIELLDQISRTLTMFGAPHGMISPDYTPAPEERIQVASVFTLARRLRSVPAPNFLVVDEAHHATLGSTWGNVINHYADTRVLGVTATPERLGGEGLGDIFDCMFQGGTVRDLIKRGYLADYRMYAPAEPVDTRSLGVRGGDYAKEQSADLMMKPAVVGDAIAHYRDLLNGAPTVGFHVSVKHAFEMAERYKEAGYQAVAVHGQLARPERARIIGDFAAGKINFLASCDLISEGFDVPGIVGAQLLRPTESLSLYLQQVGRALRTAPGKDRAIVLDHVGNSRRHGLPCESRSWTLEKGSRKRRADPDDIQIRQCSKCGAVMIAGAVACEECGAELLKTPREIKEIEGALAEVERVAAKRARRQEQGQADDMRALIELGKKRGMKNPHGWAYHVMRSRKAKRRG